MLRRKLEKRKIEIFNFDLALFRTILILLVLGIAFVADISAPQALNYFDDKFFFIKQQLVWATIGFISMIFFSLINYKIWQKIALPIFIFSLLTLVAVLIPGISLQALGARRWISIGSVNFQPSEIVKLSLVLYLARLSAMSIRPIYYFVPLIIVSVLVMLQPDLGTTLSILLIGATQIFVSGVPMSYFISAAVVGFISVIGLILSSPYRKDRLMTFLEMGSDPLGSSYHIRQAILAIGSGGLFGLGLGQSKQKYLFLPEAATDSIFSAVAEEVGFFGSVAIILIFVYFVWRGLKIASLVEDQFGKVLAAGITAWIGGQALLNLSAMSAITPLTGIPLPFFSYGGTALVMIMSACGILLNISKSLK